MDGGRLNISQAETDKVWQPTQLEQKKINLHQPKLDNQDYNIGTQGDRPIEDWKIVKKSFRQSHSIIKGQKSSNLTPPICSDIQPATLSFAPILEAAML